MSRPLLRLAVSLCALAGLIGVPATAAPAAAATSPVPAGFVGMNLDGPMFPDTAAGIDLDQQLSTMAASGVDTVRVVFDWSAAQPYRTWSKVPAAQRSNFVSAGGTPTDFAPLDEIVGLAASHGLTVLPTVLYPPHWDVTKASATSYGRPTRLAPFAAFLTALVHRYGPRGSFWSTSRPKVPIRAWQIWNEPDIWTFWPTQPFARTFVPLMHAADQAIKHADRGAKVVLAGLTNYSWRDLEQIYRIKGARSDFDEVAIHPYTAKPNGVITILSYARQVMSRAGDARKPLLADEVGWASSVGRTKSAAGQGFATTQRGQASRIAAVLPLLAANRVRLRLAGFDLYTWAGDEVPNSYVFDFAGLLRYSDGTLTAKPALSAFTKAALSIEHCRVRAARAPGCAQR